MIACGSFCEMGHDALKGCRMDWRERIKTKSQTMDVLATAGTIGLHMVSGPMVGFAIGYGLPFVKQNNSPPTNRR